MSHLNTEVHTDLVHPGIDVGVDLDIPDTRLASEGNAETLDHETGRYPDRSFIPVEDDRAGPGELTEAGQETVGELDLARHQLATLSTERLQQGQQQRQQGALGRVDVGLYHVADLVTINQ